MQPIFIPRLLSDSKQSYRPLLTSDYHDMMKHQAEYQQHNTRCTCGVKHNIIHDKFVTSKEAMRNKILFILFTLVSFLLICLLIYILFPKNNNLVAVRQTNTLKLVNLFNRHGDRAPSDRLPLNDNHASKATFFWPNGLHNLTKIGRLREFALGLETRKHYQDFIDFNSSSILAFSSEMYRCRESLAHFLRGIYDVSTTTSESLAFFNKCHNSNGSQQSMNEECRLPAGSGSPDEWKKVRINFEENPGTSLGYEILNKCKYALEHKSPVDLNLLASKSIRALNGIEKYKKLLEIRYEQKFDFDALTIWNVVNAELNLVRTSSSLEYADHFRDWIQMKPSSSLLTTEKEPESSITMLELAEEVCVLAHRDRVDGLKRRIQLGPIIESLVYSQSVALGIEHHERFRMYEGKKLIIYSSHDTILQLLWFSFNLIEADDAPFEERFHKWGKSDNDLIKLLHGLKMTEFGHSARFELWEGTRGNSKRFPYVKVSMYNRAAFKFHQIEYEPVEIGTSCRKMFMRRYPLASSHELARFYDKDIELDTKFSCPFHLFRNITSELILDTDRIAKLCNPHSGLYDI